MRTEQQLLASIKQTRSDRVRFLTMQDQTQLVKLIEQLGHFKSVDKDIAWLEEKINLEKEAK
jgi:hypothetical protein